MAKSITSKNLKLVPENNDDCCSGCYFLREICRLNNHPNRREIETTLGDCANFIPGTQKTGIYKYVKSKS